MLRIFLLVALVSAHEIYQYSIGYFWENGCRPGTSWKGSGSPIDSCDDVEVGCKDIGAGSTYTRCYAIPHTHGNGGLDPHFRKLNGKLFSYHGECDLVFVSSSSFASGAGLDIHIRTEIRKTYSFIAAVAMRVGNETFEMEGKHSFRINDELFDHPPPPLPVHKISNIAHYKCLLVQREMLRCSNISN